MCYYNSIRVPSDGIIQLGEYKLLIAEPHLFNRDVINGFDYGPYPVLKKSETGNVEISEMEWGFLPAYIRSREQATRFRFGYKKPNGRWQQPFTTLNAKGEELLQPNKIFRESALHRRCLVISCGFFEWRHVYPISARTGKPLKTPQKYPYHISLQKSEYFYMAGVWQPWHDTETGEYVETFAIVTTEANALMSQIHNSRRRMPVILPENLAIEWLMDDIDEERISELAAFQISSSELEVHTIAKNFREQAYPWATVEYAELPPLEIKLD